jgi:VWFA-related protein
VTVTDTSGRYLTDLTREQVHVFEDATEQEITTFNRRTVPIALALLLDTSASMSDRMLTAQESVIGFVRRLRPEDLGELIGFSERVQVLQGLTSDQDALVRAVRKTSPGGPTPLYQAVYISLKELKKIRAASPEELRRQAIVVFTDGEDTSSLVTFDELLDLARRSETALYTIGLRSPLEVTNKTYMQVDYGLRQLAQETGGRPFFLTSVFDLAGIYTQIADELASQYVVGYVSKNSKHDGAWRRVAVRVDREGATARTRLGYFATKK